MIARWRERTRSLTSEISALALAYRDPRTPWRARIVLLLVVGYAFSPIDLIPDFVPVLGYLDDLILLPLGIALALRLVPAAVMEDARLQVRTRSPGAPGAKMAAALIALVWLGLTALLLRWAVRRWYH